jgi:hypothetical protein
MQCSLPGHYLPSRGWCIRVQIQRKITILEKGLENCGGGEQISSSSFNREQYSLAISRHSKVQGIVIQDDQLLPTSLPKASTALPEDPGLPCLRALVTGLLCFYDVEASLAILAAVIPTTIIQRNHEDSECGIGGQVVSAIREYLNSVAVKEDNNVFRKYLL